MDLAHQFAREFTKECFCVVAFWRGGGFESSISYERSDRRVHSLGSDERRLLLDRKERKRNVGIADADYITIGDRYIAPDRFVVDRQTYRGVEIDQAVNTIGVFQHYPRAFVIEMIGMYLEIAQLVRSDAQPVLRKKLGPPFRPDRDVDNNADCH
jgi:hypothetical protein